MKGEQPGLPRGEVDRVFFGLTANLNGVEPMQPLAQLDLDDRERQIEAIEKCVLEVLATAGGEMDGNKLAESVSDDLVCDLKDVSIGLAYLTAKDQIDPYGAVVRLTKPTAFDDTQAE